MRTRFAPTPSGYLHIGNAYSFLLTWILARQSEDGQILLRIDDIDSTRARDEYIEDIFQTIDWLGLDYDQGPFSVDDFKKNWSQELRYHRYQQAFDKLKEQGDLFACNCSRKEVFEQSPSGLYTGKCRDLNLPFSSDNAVRIKTTPTPILLEDLFIGDLAIDVDAVMKDFIIRRKDGLFSYQLASLIDDEDDGIDFIVRGEDLVESSAAQIFLGNKLELENFEEVEFLHHPLLVDEKGEKLSKSDGADSIKALREGGMTPQEIYSSFAEFYLGEEVEITHIEQLLDIDFIEEEDEDEFDF
ncbi:glutamate--tRNA ligase family protein [Flammeovirga agarivorans]|uniref:tRNA glutamyl-Q synthetase n=1 Tax=Flammeovirga agarivorans TaxID=2726742 RepID=A0A7X8XZ89_9BACT|nr:glutamate--tRNA ligase family protein [Flammeovirga agarivorans]NLR94775.1 tRNA glutamyl-Q synthetase [Flammeovirga agarivorans]